MKWLEKPAADASYTLFGRPPPAPPQKFSTRFGQVWFELHLTILAPRHPWAFPSSNDGLLGWGLLWIFHVTKNSPLVFFLCPEVHEIFGFQISKTKSFSISAPTPWHRRVLKFSPWVIFSMRSVCTAHEEVIITLQKVTHSGHVILSLMPHLAMFSAVRTQPICKQLRMGLLVHWGM